MYISQGFSFFKKLYSTKILQYDEILIEINMKKGILHEFYLHLHVTFTFFKTVTKKNVILICVREHHLEVATGPGWVW